MDQIVSIIGGGLAGCECACQLADRGVRVRLYEMRPHKMSAAHHTGHLAELVCSNSLKSLREDSAAGMLKRELTQMGSVLLECAKSASVPAGGALAVDRDVFASCVEKQIAQRDRIEVIRKEVSSIPDGPVVIAAGPLCSAALADAISDLTGSARLSFFDAAAPIVEADSLDMDILFSQSRYEDSDTGDIMKDFETRDLFQACQPAEEVARKGIDAIRFGAMKPVGLTDPRTGRRPWAAVQLRAENRDCTAYNLVGFQTNLTFPEQKRVFRMIPGLEHAEFSRFGVMHRNTFIDSPHVLDKTMRIPGTKVRFAGQIAGTEGYTEAIASGLLAALNTFADLSSRDYLELPNTSVLGCLIDYATDPAVEDYQPMHVNFGIMPPLEDGRRRSKRDRYAAYSQRGKDALERVIRDRGDLFDRNAL